MEVILVTFLSHQRKLRMSKGVLITSAIIAAMSFRRHGGSVNHPLEAEL